MRKRHTHHLKVGDTIVLKHCLGSGPIVQIIWEYSEGCGQPPECRFPMIQYQQIVTNQLTWCTYLVIDTIHHHHEELRIVL